MYIIGISPGAYQIAKSLGGESAREFAGIEEKLRFGYTAGCNFFQIDQEVFGEFVEPNLVQRISRLISEMNIQWALHGLLIGEVYQTLESINFLVWKLSHLVLHRDLTFLYQILNEIKRKKYPKETFPHYTIYHASKEIVVGYALFREREAISEILTVTPEGSTNWEDFLEKREKLRNWFLENILEILFRREVQRRFAGFILSPLTIATLNCIYLPIKENRINEEEINFLLNKILEKMEIKNIQIQELSEALKKVFISFKEELRLEILDENIDRYIDFLQVGREEKRAFLLFLENLPTKLKRIFEEMKKFFKEKNLLEEFKRNKIKSLELSFETYKKRYERGIAKGAILYEDVAMAIVCKDVEFGAIYEDYPSFLKNKTCKFLIERLLENSKDGKEEVIENHVRQSYERLGIKNGKEFIDIENLEINLTPELNALGSIVYMISHFIIGIENFPEILEETSRRIQHLDEKEKEEIMKFARLNAFEKLKTLIKELRNLGINREEAFFIALETPEASPPYEGLKRICRLKDVFIATETLNLEFEERTKTEERGFTTCIDTEHMLSNAFNIDNEIVELIKYVEKYSKFDKVYSRVAIYHVGVPKPYFGTTHLPFDIGSDEQIMIYEYCSKLKKVGFNHKKINDKERNSYLIFERGSGSLPYQFLRTALLALRMIKKYLELDINPDEILSKKEYYSEFFGLDEQLIREREIIFQHAVEPLRGLIVWPEEFHTIFGKEALEKYRKRPEEWVAEEYR